MCKFDLYAKITKMNREQAYKILTSLISSQNLIKHHLACEAAMMGIYERIQNSKHEPIDEKEKEKWGIVGLLHDADYELTKNTPEKHTLVLEEKLKDQILPEIMHSIKSHNYKYSKATPISFMDWAIVACDELTGLIIAAALVHPDKKLESIDKDFVLKRFNEKSFAKGADRKPIKMCENELGIPLDNFIYIVLISMQKIHNELGL